MSSTDVLMQWVRKYEAERDLADALAAILATKHRRSNHPSSPDPQVVAVLARYREARK